MDCFQRTDSQFRDGSLTAVQTSSWKVLFPTRNYFNMSALAVLSSDHMLGRGPRQDIDCGLWSVCLYPALGLGSRQLSSSEDRSLLKALGKLSSASIFPSGSVVKFVWLYLILKNITNDGQETTDNISCEAYFQEAQDEMSSLPVEKVFLLLSMIYISKQPFGRM